MLKLVRESDQSGLARNGPDTEFLTLLRDALPQDRADDWRTVAGTPQADTFVVGLLTINQLRS